MNSLRTVELFAGIGGFRIAAEQCGIDTIWANDNSPKACAVYRDIFGEAALQEGDINSLVSTIPPHDLLTAGFPCQPFSSAGKKEGIRDSRGTLFQVIATILAHHQPTYFVLENVKRLLLMERGSHFATILSVLAKLDYQIEWRLLNALHFGLPQNRQRILLIGVHKNKILTSSFSNDYLPAIRLATREDLRELSDNLLGKLLHPIGWNGVNDHGKQIPTWGIACQGKFFAATLSVFSEKSPLTPLRSILESDVSPNFDFTESTLERLKGSKSVMKHVHGVEILSNQSGGARMGYTVFGINGVAPTLTATTSRHYERYKIGDRYRRLTNIEYARIQGFPDHHCKAVPVYDQYGLLGNAVPPQMARWVLSRLMGEGINPQEIRDTDTIASLASDYNNQLALFGHTTR